MLAKTLNIPSRDRRRQRTTQAPIRHFLDSFSPRDLHRVFAVIVPDAARWASPIWVLSHGPWRMVVWQVLAQEGLTGQFRAVKGILATAMLAARENKFGVIVPVANAAEAAVVESLDLIPIEPYNVDLDKVFKVASQYDIDALLIIQRRLYRFGVF